MKTVLDYIAQHQQAFLDTLVNLLWFPSISGQPEHAGDVADCADFLVDKLAALGFKSELIPTAGHPLVYGEYSHPENTKTLLIYGHYDVQPVDPLDLWTNPPFEPVCDDKFIYARGATDDKGQLLTHILAAQAFLKTLHRIPVNLKFLLEGEEESVGDNLEIFVRENPEKLRADGVVVSDTAMYGDGIPAITYALRGNAGAEILVSGPDHDLHSGGFGGAIANPVTELARIIARLHDQDMRVAIDGFYDRVRELESWEQQALQGLPSLDGEFLASTGSPSLFGEAGHSTLERIWTRPTCEVNGIYGGYQGEGGKTIVPATAGAKLTMRLVPDQSPTEILDKLEKFVQRVASPGVRVSLKKSGGAMPVLMSRDNILSQAAIKAFTQGFGQEPVFVRCGGSIPIINVFREALGLETLLLGFGREDNNTHSPNEKMHLDDFHRGIITVAHLFAAVGEIEI